MNELVQYKDILTILKNLAKSKGIKYSQISEKTGIAESSLRKIFTGRDCPLVSLLKICTALDITLDEVLSLQKSKKVELYIFNDEQDSYFSEFYECYKFYIRILRGSEIDEVVRDLDISDANKRQYIKDLEKIKLIERMPKNVIKFLHQEALRIMPDSRLYYKITKEVADSLLEKLPSNDIPLNEKVYQIGSVRSSKKLLRNFIEDINKCYEEFEIKVSKEVKHLSEDELVPVTYVLAVGEHNTIGR